MTGERVDTRSRKVLNNYKICIYSGKRWWLYIDIILIHVLLSSIPRMLQIHECFHASKISAIYFHQRYIWDSIACERFIPAVHKLWDVIYSFVLHQRITFAPDDFPSCYISQPKKPSRSLACKESFSDASMIIGWKTWAAAWITKHQSVDFHLASSSTSLNRFHPCWKTELLNIFTANWEYDNDIMFQSLKRCFSELKVPYGRRKQVGV